MLSQLCFLPGIVLILLGLKISVPAAIYAGRLLFTIGVVALFDFLLADAGKYKAFQERQKEAAAKAAEVRPPNQPGFAGGAHGKPI